MFLVHNHETKTSVCSGYLSQFKNVGVRTIECLGLTTVFGVTIQIVLYQQQQRIMTGNRSQSPFRHANIFKIQDLLETIHICGQKLFSSVFPPCRL